MASLPKGLGGLVEGERRDWWESAYGMSKVSIGTGVLFTFQIYIIHHSLVCKSKELPDLPFAMVLFGLHPSVNSIFIQGKTIYW